ncbi:hypothetical protein [Kitasatospora sp. NPDC088346]|uniref:hypothetical protein n=1 Tax=Kitasatospora sp. NPDC088346 TaxID=3364073 RepID=UPI0038088B94
MIEDFRDSLNEELSGLAEPPLGDLVVTAVQRGRGRVRRNRVVAAAAGSVVAVAAVTALLLGPPGAGRAHTPAIAVGGPATGRASTPATGRASIPATGPESTPVTGTPTHRPTVAIGGATAESAGPPVNVTPSALLAAVVDALPAGKTGNYAVSGGVLGVQVYLETGRGVGLVRVFVSTEPADLADCDSSPKPGPGGRLACFVDRRGQTTAVVTGLEGNCLATTSVLSVREDGTTVHVVVGTCLAWNGSTNPPAPPALTVDQAVELAGDPSIGAWMDPDFVQTAAKRFPGLPTFR